MKSFHFSLLVLVGLWFTACNSSSTKPAEGSESGEITAKVEFPKAFYKKLKGTIGDGIPVTMDLMKDDTALSGNYYYDKVGLPLNLDGSLSPENTAELREWNEKYEETGHFSGKFTSETIFEGTWTNPKTKKSLPFKLEETKEGVAAITFEDFHEDNCKNKERNLKNPKPEEEQMFTDTMCSYIDVHLLKVNAANATVTASINQALLSEITSYNETPYATIEAYVHSIQNLETDEYLSLEQTCTVVTNDHDILSVAVGTYEFAGGAHPLSGVTYVNADLQTGKLLKLADLLNPNSTAALNKIGERLFFDENGGEEGEETEPMVWDFEPGNFKLNDNFAITTGGLLFTFNQYEIGPYAAGMPQVFIPYKEIDDLIRKDGALGRFGKN